MNAKLKRLFIEQGWPQECELKLPGCLKNWALTWAHSRRSRYLKTEEEWMHAALTCVNCHQAVDSKPHKETFKIISDAINRRPMARPALTICDPDE
jgi:hypothetical protein